MAGSATAAAAAGTSPFRSDAAILAPIQVSMIAGITSVLDWSSQATLSTLVTSAVAWQRHLVGRTIVVSE